MRTLVFDSMPGNASPDSHIAAGAWCFAGREELFPGWDGTPCPGRPDARPFPLPPDPYPDAAAIAGAARAANSEALRLARLLGPRLFGKPGGNALSERFHDMALGPFTLLAAHVLAERQKRVRDLVICTERRNCGSSCCPGPCPFPF